MRRQNDTIRLTEEQRQKMIEEIQQFFEVEREEKIGILASEKILDFFITALGERIYNKALDDVLFWYKSNMENMESDFCTMYRL